MKQWPILWAGLMVVGLPGLPVLAADTGAVAMAGIDWQKGDVDAAFALAKANQKPLFLYWGAAWCPPCNQVKATIFNQQAFIDRSRSFVPVYLDGDSPNAQQLGERFQVRGYPTMILFKPDGTEITRLPGELDLRRYLQVLDLGMSSALPVGMVLARAQDGKTTLHANDWRLLADYSWDTDEAKLVEPEKRAAVLYALGAKCPQRETAARLMLKALAAANEGQPALDEPSRRVAARHVASVLANARLARQNFDILTGYASDIVPLIEKQGVQRDRLLASWDKVLQRLSQDPSLSTADRLSALTSRVALAKLDGKTPSVALQQAVRQQVAKADQMTQDRFERQAVISTAAYTLTEVGLMPEADQLLTAELSKSHSPYYFMLSLAGNAKKRGDKAQALTWYEKAYATSEGPATRLQWGASYVLGLLELSPEDEPRIDQAVHQILNELNGQSNVFYERNRRSLEKIALKLAGWNQQGQHESVVTKVKGQLDGLCQALSTEDPQRQVCQGLVQVMDRKPGAA
ncbi:thiol-disulfide isomerase/thioredoxin [Chitinivorax tropicus]|uniref:Thiol-disulfide isomerase/thioredoxin n=1 Tax=Chitinivorax tropicus TaxID=714531 RepID=A0A840ME01_9PROT|nr:thioredoxin fold domain-containing protein [Chitinivorax tropicus]MBB5016908.1 thiol-disulfide isomerase/thioredoxin [Chitinivorax tropicus]